LSFEDLPVVDGVMGTDMLGMRIDLLMIIGMKDKNFFYRYLSKLKDGFNFGPPSTSSSLNEKIIILDI
jgi:hypothetical protein